MNESPIGIFDSGMGGLTVMRALKAHLPNENFIYLGDTARLPYGTKGADTVTRYAIQAARALIARDVKMLVVVQHRFRRGAANPGDGVRAFAGNRSGCAGRRGGAGGGAGRSHLGDRHWYSKPRLCWCRWRKKALLRARSRGRRWSAI